MKHKAASTLYIKQKNILKPDLFPDVLRCFCH
jgi:hypothetical protein